MTLGPECLVVIEAEVVWLGNNLSCARHVYLGRHVLTLHHHLLMVYLLLARSTILIGVGRHLLVLAVDLVSILVKNERG